MKKLLFLLASTTLLAGCAERKGPLAPVTFGKPYGAPPVQKVDPVARPAPAPSVIETEKLDPEPASSKPVRLKPERQHEEEEEAIPQPVAAPKKEQKKQAEPLLKEEKPLPPPQKEEKSVPEEVKPSEIQEKPEVVKESSPASTRFIRPVAGPVVQAFSPEAGNDGVNISAAKGTPVKAASSGVVAYAGNEVQGFGNLILLKHAGGWMSIYGHLDNVLVKKGEKIKAGQEIGSVGTSGAIKAPQLHFELRQNSKPVNPEDHLS